MKKAYEIAVLLVFICLQLLYFVPVSAQKKIEYQRLIWGRYYNKLAVTERYELHTEIDERRFIGPWKQHQLAIRSHLHYKLKKEWDIGAGFTYFLQSPHDPESKSTLMVPELRPHQEVNYKSKLSERWSFRERLKAEERFFRKIEKDQLVSGYNFNFRFRIKADLIYTILKDSVKNDLLTFIISNEIMFNAGKHIVNNMFDQNRLYAGIKWNILPFTALEGGYLYWFQQRTSGDQFYHRDIIRFTLHHHISLIKKQM